MKSSSKRKAQQRQRLINQGFVRQEVWVHKLDLERYNEFKTTLRLPEVHDAGTEHREQHSGSRTGG